MSELPLAMPPLSVNVVQVVLVRCERGLDEWRRPVLQVWSMGGDLLAEHDEIHDDPIYPAHFLRDNLSKPPQSPAPQAQPAMKTIAAGEDAHA